MSKCDFNKAALQFALQHGCSSANLLQIFRTPFPKNTSGWRAASAVFGFMKTYSASANFNIPQPV